MSEDPRKHAPTLETFRRVMDRRASEGSLRRAPQSARTAPKPPNGSAGGHRAAAPGGAARAGGSRWTQPRMAAVAVAAVIVPLVLMYALLVRPKEQAAESQGAPAPGTTIAATGPVAVLGASPEATPGPALGEASDAGTGTDAAADAAVEAGMAAPASSGEPPRSTPSSAASPTARNPTLPAEKSGKNSRSGEGANVVSSARITSPSTASPRHDARRPAGYEPPPGGRTPEF